MGEEYEEMVSPGASLSASSLASELTDQQRGVSSADQSQRKWDYDAMTAIAAHLRENPAHPFSGRQCEEFVLDARDRLYGDDDQSGCEATDAARQLREGQ